MPFSNLSNISNLMVPPTTTMSAHVEAANPHPMYLLTSSLVDAVSAKITVDCLNDVHVEDVSMLDSTVLFHSAGVWQPLPVATLLSGVRVGYATTVESGIVRLATYNDISVKNSIAAVTPNLLVDYVSEALVPVNSTISSIQYAVDHLSTPYATTDASGVVKLAVYPDIAGNNSSTVITPNLLKEYVTSAIINFNGTLEIPTVANATTTENGIVRLATLDDVSNTNLTIEDPIVVTPPILDAYVQTSVSVINNNIALKQDKLSAGTGIEIVSMSNGTPVYPQVINCTVSYHPGTGIDIDGNNSIHCTITSKEYHPGSNIDIDSNDSIHCTYVPPNATTTIAGIVKLIDSLPCNDSDLHTAAITPGALVDSTISGVINKTWRPVSDGKFQLGRGDATITDGCLKFPFLRTGSLCLAMVWGRTDLIRNEKTCMYDIDIRSVGQDKLYDVITVNFNVEPYGGPEAYVRSKSGNMSGTISYGGVNYDRNDASYFATADTTTSSVNTMASGVHFIVDPNDIESPYTPIDSTRINITGRGDAEYQLGSKNNQQNFELDNVVVQYAGAIHTSRVNSYGKGYLIRGIESISNPVTHLRTVLNHINTSAHRTWFYAHWWVLGFTTVSASVWNANEVPLPDVWEYVDHVSDVTTTLRHVPGELIAKAYAAANFNESVLINVFNNRVTTDNPDDPELLYRCTNEKAGDYNELAFLAPYWSIKRVVGDYKLGGYYKCPGFHLYLYAETNARKDYYPPPTTTIVFDDNTRIDMATCQLIDVLVNNVRKTFTFGNAGLHVDVADWTAAYSSNTAAVLNEYAYNGEATLDFQQNSGPDYEGRNVGLYLSYTGDYIIFRGAAKAYGEETNYARVVVDYPKNINFKYYYSEKVKKTT